MLDEKFSTSPVYQWTIEKGIAIGEERGKAEGIAIGEERGKAEGIAIGETKAQVLAQARRKVMKNVLEGFPSLALRANDVLAMIDNVDPLVDLAMSLAKAQSIEEAEQILLESQIAGEGYRSSSSIA